MYRNEFEKDIRGLDKSASIITIDDELYDLKKRIDNYREWLVHEIGGLKTGISSKDMEEEARRFLSTLIELHNVKQVNERDLVKKIEPQAFLFGNVFEEIRRVMDEIEPISPYDIPVLYDVNNEYSGRTDYVRHNGGSLQRLRESDVLVDSIHLPRSKNGFTPSLYVRELIDTQVKTSKGSIKDFNNDYVASNFFEYLSTGDDRLKNRIYKYIILTSISDHIEYLRSVKTYKDQELLKEHAEKSSATVSSGLKTFNLIEVFNDSDILGRRAILDDMQDVFDAKVSMDDILKKHDISMETGQKVLSKKIEKKQ